MTESGLSPQLLEILRCPCPAHGPLAYLADQSQDRAAEIETSTIDGELICDECHRAFPVRDGIPVMLLDEARSTGRSRD